MSGPGPGLLDFQKWTEAPPETSPSGGGLLDFQRATAQDPRAPPAQGPAAVPPPATAGGALLDFQRWTEAPSEASPPSPGALLPAPSSGSPATGAEADLARGMLKNLRELEQGFSRVGPIYDVEDQADTLQDPAKRAIAESNIDSLHRQLTGVQTALNRADEARQLRGEPRAYKEEDAAIDAILEGSPDRREETPSWLSTAAQGFGLMGDVIDFPFEHTTRAATEAAGVTSPGSKGDIDQWTADMRKLPGIGHAADAIDTLATPLYLAGQTASYGLKNFADAMRRAPQKQILPGEPAQDIGPDGRPMGGVSAHPTVREVPGENVGLRLGKGEVPGDWLWQKGVERPRFFGNLGVQVGGDPLTIVGGAIGRVGKIAEVIAGPLRRAGRAQGFSDEAIERAVQRLQDPELVKHFGTRSGRTLAQRAIAEELSDEVAQRAFGPNLEYLGSIQAGLRPPLVSEAGLAAERLGGLVDAGFRNLGLPQAARLEAAGARLRDAGRPRALSEMTRGRIPDYAGRRAAEVARRGAGRAAEWATSGRWLERMAGDRPKRWGQGERARTEISRGERARERAEVQDIAVAERTLRKTLRGHYRRRLVELAQQHRAIPKTRREELVRYTIDPDFANVFEGQDPTRAAQMGDPRATRPLYPGYEGPTVTPPEGLLPQTLGEHRFVDDINRMLEEANEITRNFGSPIGTNVNPATGRYYPRARRDTPHGEVVVDEEAEAAAGMRARGDYYRPEGVRNVNELDEPITVPAPEGVDLSYTAPGAGHPLGAVEPEAEGVEAVVDPFEVLPGYFEGLADKQARTLGDARLAREFGRVPLPGRGPVKTHKTLQVPLEEFTRSNDAAVPDAVARSTQRLREGVVDLFEPAPEARGLADAQAELAWARREHRHTVDAVNVRRKRGMHHWTREGEQKEIPESLERLRAAEEKVRAAREEAVDQLSPVALATERAQAEVEVIRGKLNEAVAGLRGKIRQAERDKDKLNRQFAARERDISPPSEAEARAHQQAIDQIDIDIVQAGDALKDAEQARKITAQNLVRTMEQEMYVLEREVPARVWQHLQTQRGQGGIARVSGWKGFFEYLLKQGGTKGRGSRIASAVGGTIDLLVNHWKRLALIGRPAYNALNVVSDSVMLYTNGVDNPARALRQASKGIRDNDGLAQEFADFGFDLEEIRNTSAFVGPLSPFAGKGAGASGAGRLEFMGEHHRDLPIRQAVREAADPRGLGTSAQRLYRGAVKVGSADGERIARAWDVMSKHAAYRHARETLGMAPAQAFRFMRNALIDYEERDRVENIARLIIPFTKWLRFAPQATAQAAWQSPTRTLAAFRAQEAALGGGPDQEAPQWMRDRGVGYSAGPGIRDAFSLARELGGGTSLEPAEGLFVQGRALPLLEAWNPIAQAIAKGNPRPLGQALHPAVGTFAEWLTDRSLVTGRPQTIAFDSAAPAGMPGLPAAARVDQPNELSFWTGKLAPMLLGSAGTFGANVGINAFMSAIGSDYDNPVTLGQTRGFRLGNPRDLQIRQGLNLLSPLPAYTTLPGQQQGEIMRSRAGRNILEAGRQIHRNIERRSLQRDLEAGPIMPSTTPEEQVDDQVDALFGFF